MWPLPVILFALVLYKIFTQNRKLFLAICISYALLQLICLIVFFNFIYRPQLSHKAVAEIFQEIKVQSQNKSYAVANDFLDVNQFLYYLTFSGLPNRNIYSTSYTINYINDCQVFAGEIIKNTQGLCLSKEERKR